MWIRHNAMDWCDACNKLFCQSDDCQDQNDAMCDLPMIKGREKFISWSKTLSVPSRISERDVEFDV